MRSMRANFPDGPPTDGVAKRIEMEFSRRTGGTVGSRCASLSRQGFERQHLRDPWPLVAASRPHREVMPSRSYLLKPWPTRPNQEDDAQLLRAPRASMSQQLKALSRDGKIPTACASRPRCNPELGATGERGARLSAHRPMQGWVRVRIRLPLTSPPPRLQEGPAERCAYIRGNVSGFPIMPIHLTESEDRF